MSIWPAAKLIDVATINPRRPKLERADDYPTTFIPMSAVAEDGAGIVAAQLKPFGTVKKGYTYFEAGDVLFAKITPCMQNGKHAIVRGCEGGFGFGSTEFHVVRAGARVTPEWLHYFLIQPSVLDEAKKQFTGAVGQQRVPDSFLRELAIPVPPLDAQCKIIAKLSEALVEVKRALRVADEQRDAIMQLPSRLLLAAFTEWEAG